MNKSKLIVSLAAATVAAAVVPGAASAAPLVNVRMVVDGGANDGASTVAVNAGDVVNFRIVAELAPLGTVNTTANPDVTLSSKVDASDGINSARFNVFQPAGDGIQVDFDAITTLSDLYNDGINNSGGTLVARGNGNDDLDSVRAVGAAGQFAVGRGAAAPVTLATGSFDIASVSGTTGTVQMSYLDPNQSPGAFRVNGGANSIIAANTDADPYYGFTGLTVTAVPEPASLGVVGLAGVALLARRRNRR